jgi:hypothetical protein|tara:strand:- start:280 stop:765 length:486 start_codon:yes stop_codon:yes gene_type:complete
MAVSAIAQETGQQSTTANSYVTEAGYNQYLEDRYSRTAPASDTNLRYIYRAMTYFESLRFQGDKATDEQALQWPRTGVTIDGYGIDSDEIPNEVLVAIYEIAYGYEQEYGIDSPVSRETLKEKVGDLEVEYKASSADRVLLPAATQALRKLVKNPMRTVRA